MVVVAMRGEERGRGGKGKRRVGMKAWRRRGRCCERGRGEGSS